MTLLRPLVNLCNLLRHRHRHRQKATSHMAMPATPAHGDTTLPRPTGPHTVGYSDVDFESHCGRTVLCRLHFPLSSADTQYTTGNRGMWLPSEEYYSGYGYYLRIPAWLSGALFKYVAGHVQMWAISKPPRESIVKAKGAIVLSHGLGGIRTTYSTLCCELASHGYLVAAVEHRDGSASVTVDSAGRSVPYSFPNEHNEFSFRSMQLGHRVEEVRAVKEFLRGNFSKIVSEDIEDIMDIVKVAKDLPIYGMGHSMGAATMMKGADMFPAIVALDPWTFPLPKNMPPLRTASLIIAMENFEWPNNQQRLLSLMQSQPMKTYLMIKNADHVDQSDVPVVMPEVVRWRMRTTGCLEPEVIIRMTGDIAKNFLGTMAVGDVDQDLVAIIR